MNSRGFFDINRLNFLDGWESSFCEFLLFFLIRRVQIKKILAHSSIIGELFRWAGAVFLEPVEIRVFIGEFNIGLEMMCKSE